MGLDRLVMFLTDSANIKEVLVSGVLCSDAHPPKLTPPSFSQLFPAMKPIANFVPGAADAAAGEVAEKLEKVVLEDRKTISADA